MQQQEATSIFQVASWEESPFGEADCPARLARVQATHIYQGDFSGEGHAEYLIAYKPDGTASFVGIEHITGEMGNRSGSFVIEHIGSFVGERACSKWVILTGSGSGQLASLSGDGSSLAGDGKPATATMRYELRIDPMVSLALAS
ncbi:DUF3224 domain-containing protein [Uliginosibacterium sp. H1]|uniref:DUF3224 domain-containing protein n=1 Tax=Uliginosibacterium sp. H1 TaxID=3114757 RepID=UPI002E1789B2|nr:DUF3224 domain-containing protein [Uliginosibacterium sp. H1]